MAASDMFRPPINRSMRVLDRSFFRKQIPMSAARMANAKDISRTRTELTKSKDAFILGRVNSVQADPESADPKSGKKCLLLRPQMSDDGTKWPWSPRVADLEREQIISVIPFTLDLDYDYWTYHDIASAILPPSAATTSSTHTEGEAAHAEEEEIPSGFTHVGHVAHLNLRDRYLPYKSIIGQVLLDKNPGIKTVINKIDDVGGESEYRTFKYEVLAGVNDMDVELRELDCTFRFNYAKVYWNSRLNTEHERMVGKFEPGQAVCDVMAGIGPFAIPAGKRQVFVWANDLNPESRAALVDNIAINKVGDFVQPFCADGNDFIRTATERLRSDSEHRVDITKKLSRTEVKAAASARRKGRSSSPTATNGQQAQQAAQTITRPRFFSHYVMNLPATAITFLPSFIGLFSSGFTSSAQVKETPGFKLPWIHVYCFSHKSDDNVSQSVEIAAEISRQIGFEMKPIVGVQGEAQVLQEGEVEVYDVRDVAPNKRMFCASFKLPEEVAFRKHET